MIGLDVGITNTDLVIVEKGRIKKSIGAPSGEGVALRLLSLASNFEEECEIAITGAGAKAAELPPMHRILEVNEIDAIGIGGAKLARSPECIVASIGTGTAIVYVKGKKCKHMGGTGVGGGTLVGLGKKLLGTGDAMEISALAEKGDWGKVNITVGDVYGHGIGIVPGDATAANFAKNGKTKKVDVAAGIINLVGETAGVLACFAAREKNVEDIVFVGAVPTLRAMPKVLERTAKMFGFRAVIPEEARFSTALGATICIKYNIYIRRKH